MKLVRSELNLPGIAAKKQQHPLVATQEPQVKE
jgi:hypothetical protein